MTKRKSKNGAFRPCDMEKVDTGNKVDLKTLIERHREIEKSMRPLRIDRNTVIYVKSEKCSEAYAEAFRKKINNGVVAVKSDKKR